MEETHGIIFLFIKRFQSPFYYLTLKHGIHQRSLEVHTSHAEGKSIFCCEKWGRGVNTSCRFRCECEHIKKIRENLLLPAREPLKAFSWLALGLRGRQEKAADLGGGRRNHNKIILKIASMTFPISPELELQDWDLNSTCFKFIGIMSRQQPLFN